VKAGEISAPELLKKLDSSDVQIIHISSKESFEKKRIKNSIWVPFNQLEKLDFRLLDKSKTQILYCKNRSCMSAKLIGDLLADNGYQCLVYAGGIEEWLDLDFPLG
jgi:rhodanese-related sulfurtransferase